jgi:selenide,water dikinase
MLMVLGVSLDMDAKEREIVTREMIRGFNDTAEEAGCKITGGQSILNPWPIIGGVANTVVDQSEFLIPNRVKEGDVMLLTKPLGTQIAVNAKEWKEEKTHRYEKLLKDGIYTDADIDKMYMLSMESMGKLNKNAAGLVNKYQAGGCTDITGFGLFGHLENLTVAQKNHKLRYVISQFPVIAKTADLPPEILDFGLLKGKSAETSGGLLCMVNEKDAYKIQEELKNEYGENSWIVGHVEANDADTPSIDLSAIQKKENIIDVNSIFC